MEKRLLSVAEASQLLGMSESFLYKNAETNTKPHKPLCRAVRFDVAQIDAWLRRHSVGEVDYADKLRRKSK
jgi:excisionase family DNA binding protein